MTMKNELKWGSFLSYAQMALSVIINLTYTPVMIRLLGQSEYGLYNTVSSTISMLSVLNLGFNAGYVRYFAKYRHEENHDAVYRLNGLFLIIFSVIGLIALGCGLFLTNNLKIVFKDGLTTEEYDLARTLMLLLTINMAVSFPMSVFSTIISANERFVFLKIIGMIKTVLSPLVNLPLLLMGVRSIGLVATSLALHIITDIVYVYYVIYKLHNRFVFTGIEKGLFSNLFAYTFFIALNSIVDLINTNIDRVLLGRYAGTAAVAIYAVGMSLYQHYKSLSMAISGVFTPRIHRIYAEGYSDTKCAEKATELFIRVGRIQCLVLMLACSTLVIFGKDFIRFWAGEGYDESYYVMILIMIPASVPLIQNLGIEIQRAANKHQFRSIVYIIMAICNLILTIILCPKYGAIGAIIGTSLSIVLANGFIMNYFYAHIMNIGIFSFWKSICRLLLGIIPVWGIGWFFHRIIPFKNLLALLVGMSIYAIAFIADAWLFSMNKYEKRIFTSMVQRIAKKMKNA